MLPDTTPRKEDWLAELAFEVALGYYTPEDLQVKYDLTLEQYYKIKRLPQFKRAVQVFKRQIDEEGQQFRVKARKMATETLDVLFNLAADDEAANSDRIRAVEALCRYAGFEKGVADSAQGNQGFTVNIQINQ